MIFSHQLHGKHAGIFNGKPLLPSAADVLSFLQYTAEPAAGKWLTPVVRFARSVPAFSGNILEVHFDKQENNVDFAARLNADFDQHMIAGVQRQAYSLPFMPAVFDALLEQHGSGLTNGIENIWIEYDAPFTSAPAVFFDINKNKPFHPQAVYDRLQQITGASGYHIHVHLLQFLERIERSGLYVVYYGLMFSRKSHAVRLTINGIDPESLTGALSSLGWKGNFRTLEKIRSVYLSKQKLVIGVDFGHCLKNRIGIEVFDDDQEAFSQKLYNNGHISQAHYELLNAWRATYVLPDHLSTAFTDLYQRPVSRLYTRFNHFKFVVDDTGRITAKGYLYYCF